MVRASLSEVHTQSWNSLHAGVTEPGHEWRTFSLATVGLNQRPKVRTVVLRGTDQEARQLIFFTDPRTPKWQELLGRPVAEALFWNAQEKIQLRCQCRASFHVDDDLAARYQAQVLAHLAGDYAAANMPSAPIDFPEEGQALGTHWNFGVVVLTVEEMDWLQLRGDGHRRAGFQWRNDGEEQSWKMNWLQP